MNSSFLAGKPHFDNAAGVWLAN